MLIVTEAAAVDAEVSGVLAAARSHAARELTVTPEVFAALTQVPAPQGVLGVAPRPPGVPLPSHPEAQTLAVVLDAIQDPGNVGTIVRTAAACGATIVVACGPTADPFGAKALRASAGAAFQIPLAVRVPVLGAVESLNVAAAAAVLLYQAAGLVSPRS